MSYDQLVDQIAEDTGIPGEVIKGILWAMPDALRCLEVGERVRTPLGVFRMTSRAVRNVVPPQGGDPMPVTPEQVVKLKPGSRLRKHPSESQKRLVP